MHTVAELETNVPAFLGKLWKLVDDAETDDLICWAPNGRSFFIRNTAQFARELLPHYYKHNNMASFVRQLNMYGFHKKVSVDVGGLKCDRDEMEFAHQYFIKDHPYLLEHIKRKIASSKSQDAHPPIKTEVMNKVLSEVRSMRGRQEHLDTRLGAMKRENEALWRELAMLRRKHLKQQEIVNKLIHFLVTLVQPSRNRSRSVKRRYPLMIDAHQQDKQMKVGKPETSPSGPVIHELDPSEHDHQEHDLDSDYTVADMLDNQHPAIQSPVSIPDVFDDESTETVHYVTQTLPSKNELHVLESANDVNDVLQNNATHKSKKKGEEVGNHVVSVQNDLEQLRDTLLNEGYSIDANTLLGLFGSDDPMSFGIPVNPELNPSHEKEDEDQMDELTDAAPSGELMAYTPSTSLLDFDDDILLDANNLNSSGRNQTGNDGKDYCNEEPIDLVESKAHLLESLVSGNNSNPSASSRKSILD